MSHTVSFTTKHVSLLELEEVPVAYSCRPQIVCNPCVIDVQIASQVKGGNGELKTSRFGFKTPGTGFLSDGNGMSLFQLTNMRVSCPESVSLDPHYVRRLLV
ncbi:hypothetical protein BaRGS_00000537 [Batillaria attramentaria]|uniref:Uncharacterized protein n=1 Tax=Batillaria attramentaria TaxID=370345 RepID=A0ABD0M910_9CAEN